MKVGLFWDLSLGLIPTVTKTVNELKFAMLALTDKFPTQMSDCKPINKSCLHKNLPVRELKRRIRYIKQNIS